MDSSVAEPAAAGPHYYRPAKRTAAEAAIAQKDSGRGSGVSRDAD